MLKSIIIALALAVTFTFSVHAQTLTDREATYALVGPVRTVRTETATLIKNDSGYVEGPRVLSMTITFNENGGRTELGLYNEQGSLNRRIVTRFEGRHQVEYMNYDGAGKMWLRGVSLYDANGRVRESATYNGDGSLRSKTTLTRNERGQVIELAEYYPNGSLLDRFSNSYNNAGELKSRERVSYRPDGSLSLKESYNIPEKRVESITYNRDGSIAGKSIRVNQEINEYAADGSLKKNTSITSIGRLPEESVYEPDGTIRKESQKPDEIDSHGNWIKQTKWVSDSQGARPVKVTYRVITYYETVPER